MGMILGSFLLSLFWLSPAALAATAFTTLDELKDAVDQWADSNTRATVEATYGTIDSWNVKQVTSFNFLFSTERNPALVDFNEDISGWNVVNGANFRYMFKGCTSFNQDLSGWNVDSPDSLEGMFYNAQSFNSDLNDWTVTWTDDLSFMFYGASSFNGDLSSWRPKWSQSFGKRSCEQEGPSQFIFINSGYHFLPCFCNASRHNPIFQT